MAVLCTLAALGACSQQAGTASKTATQVVARVNGTELTVSQLNVALSDSGVSSVDTASTRKVLESLIDQQLLTEQALAAKLDRTPDVLLRIEQAKRQILAQAFESQSVYPQGTINEVELHRFYDENPAVFKQRRAYHLLGFATNVAKLPDAITSQLAGLHTPDAIRALLVANNIQYTEEELNQGADEVATDLVQPLAAAQIGDVVATVHGNEKQAALLLVEEAKDAPMSYEQSSAIIDNYMTNQRNQAAAEAYLKSLRAKSKIEYVGSVGAALTTTDADHAEAGLKNLN